MKFQFILKLIIIVFFLVNQVQSGLFSTGLCYSGCAALVCACYSAAGFTFGTVVASAATPAVIVGCNTAFGACMAKCSVATFLLP
jgi:hypothetical protein